MVDDLRAMAMEKLSSLCVRECLSYFRFRRLSTFGRFPSDPLQFGGRFVRRWNT